MNKDRLCQILLSPRVTEKTTLIGENSNQYVFHVVSDASKPEIAQAVELMELAMRMIRAGNLSGNTFDRFLYRISFGRWGK